MISRNKFSNKSAECVWYWGKPQFSHVLIIIYASSTRLLSSCLVFGLRDCYGRRLWRRLSPSDDFLQGNPPACRRIYLMFTITILKVISISSACSVNHGNKDLMIKNTTRNQTRYVFWTWCWFNSKFLGLKKCTILFNSILDPSAFSDYSCLGQRSMRIQCNKPAERNIYNLCVYALSER